MSVVITNKDLRLISQPSVNCSIKIEILNMNGTILAVLNGVIDGGTTNIDASSDVRRTASLQIVPTNEQDIEVCEANNIWLNKSCRIYVGIKDMQTEEYTWYLQGSYKFTDTSLSYDGSSNTLSVNCSDWMAWLDGTLNGIQGYLTTTIPAYEENATTGEVIEYNYIRDAMIQTVTQLGKVDKYIVEDIGEYKGIESRNPSGYLTYRANNPQWNCVPYDLEYSSGSTVLDMITELRDLYPNYETFFDVDNVFTCQMIPSLYEDAVMLSDAQIQRLLLSDSTETQTIDFTTVKNVAEVWGKVIETDFYTETCTTTDGVYVCTVESYEDDYKSGDIIAIMVDTTNIAGMQLNINSFGNIAIYQDDATNVITAGELESGQVYCFKIKKTYTDGVTTTKAIVMGQYQPHGLAVLLNSETHDEKYTTAEGITVEKYSEEYFKLVYNVKAITRQIIPDSPFAVERLDEVLAVETYESITTDGLALSQAEYTNWQNSRLTDNITINILLAPFLDVNIKVEYKPKNSSETNQYIIDSVSHDYSGGTTSVTMHRFYPLYPTSVTG